MSSSASPSPPLPDCPIAGVLSERLRDARFALSHRWLERIADRVTIERQRIFPTDELLDHVPLLIEGIADYVADPSNEVGTDTPVVAKAMELGELRHRQGFDVYQILKEYEILGGILFSYIAGVADEIQEPCDKSELLYCGQRLFKAVTLIQQTTTMHFLRLANERVSEREERLRAFNRSVSHEIKNQIGAVLAASDTVAQVSDLDPDKVRQFMAIIARNARTMRQTVDNLVALSRTDHDARQQRNVLLPDSAAEAARQLRESAEDADVEIRLTDLPAIEVNAAAVELCLINLLSNAIKYCDAGVTDRFVEVSGRIEPTESGTREIVIRVRDNGVGVPEPQRSQLFRRFFRAQNETVSRTEGTGLGLSIVSETAASIGGRAWAEFPEKGSVFAFALPFRREESGDQMPDAARDES
ncbi:MAG: sensor histidine kinase [Gemmatimonadaceae bacterium]